MTEPRIKVNRMREEVVQACYTWRAAEVHHSGCILGMRRGDLSDAAIKVRCAESDMVLKIDALHREEKSLGLI